MFIKHLSLDPDSMIEISTRVVANEHKVMISIRGKKNDQEITVISAILEPNEVKQLIDHLAQAEAYKMSVE